ncbi:sigma-70 family RNA polymerase sigma factor [Acidobacteria bacterium AH-259-D05]|nr:sigma-70 family RNA polymerase sigma factor [Acidobacteria bacterium AH-259-D05]
MPTEISQNELEETVKRVQKGSAEDFQKLYTLYSKPIYNFIWRLIGSTEDAEDLTQETFLKVHSEIKNLRQAGQFKFWLYRIARNEVYQKQRRSRKAPVVSLDDKAIDYYDFLPHQSTDIDPEKQALYQELSMVIDQTLQAMSPKYRDVFILAVFQKMSYDDITKIVDRSLLSVKTDIYRARLTVKDALSEYMKKRK